jgi:hypothetical protein
MNMRRRLLKSVKITRRGLLQTTALVGVGLLPPGH